MGDYGSSGAGKPRTGVPEPTCVIHGEEKHKEAEFVCYLLWHKSIGSFSKLLKQLQTKSNCSCKALQSCNPLQFLLFPDLPRLTLTRTIRNGCSHFCKSKHFNKNLRHYWRYTIHVWFWKCNDYKEHVQGKIWNLMLTKWTKIDADKVYFLNNWTFFVSWHNFWGQLKQIHVTLLHWVFYSKIFK